MPADAKTYPKLSRIYGELNQQNGIIFEAEKVRNSLEYQRDELKGIVWRYGFQTVQDFYRSYHTSASAYNDYQSKVKKWESTYGIKEKPKEETIADRMERYQKEMAEQNHKPISQKKDKGAR